MSNIVEILGSKKFFGSKTETLKTRLILEQPSKVRFSKVRFGKVRFGKVRFDKAWTVKTNEIDQGYVRLNWVISGDHCLKTTLAR